MHYCIVIVNYPFKLLCLLEILIPRVLRATLTRFLLRVYVVVCVRVYAIALHGCYASRRLVPDLYSERGEWKNKVTS